jgi:hypothetical protein
VKASVVSTYGGPEVMKYQDMPDPKPGAGEHFWGRSESSAVRPFLLCRFAPLAEAIQYLGHRTTRGVTKTKTGVSRKKGGRLSPIPFVFGR